MMDSLGTKSNRKRMVRLLGLVLGSLFVQGFEQLPGARRRFYGSLENDVLGANFFAIELLVGFVVRPERGAFERNACKGTSGAGITENFRAHGDVGIGRSAAALRSGCGRSIRTELHFAREYGFRTAVIHEQKNEIRRLTAQLKADAS